MAMAGAQAGATPAASSRRPRTGMSGAGPEGWQQGPRGQGAAATLSRLCWRWLSRCGTRRAAGACVPHPGGRALAGRRTRSGPKHPTSTPHGATWRRQSRQERPGVVGAGGRLAASHGRRGTSCYLRGPDGRVATVHGGGERPDRRGTGRLGNRTRCRCGPAAGVRGIRGGPLRPRPRPRGAVRSAAVRRRGRRPRARATGHLHGQAGPAPAVGGTGGTGGREGGGGVGGGHEAGKGRFAAMNVHAPGRDACRCP